MSNHPNRTRRPDNTPTPAEVQAAREKSGLTQPAAAAVIYSTLRTWQCWEGGQRPMHPAFLELFRIKTQQITKPR